MEGKNEDVVKVSRASLIGIAAAIIVLAAFVLTLTDGYIQSPYAIMFIVSFAAIVVSGCYVHKKKDELDSMCCMMAGMTFSMTSGLAAGALIAIPTNNFLLASIAGTLIGLVFGYTFGRIGSNVLSRMEGVMAAPMGGTMGAMIGIMMIPYDLSLFIKFLFFIVVLFMFEMMNVVKRHTESNIPTHVVSIFSVLVIIGFAATFVLSFGVPGSADYNPTDINQNIITQGPTGLAAVGGTRAVIAGNIQEVTLTARTGGYDPNTIIAKAGIPLKINFKAEQGAGCNRALVFPDFGVSKILQPGGSDTVQFTPANAGTYGFRCSMGMFRGKLIVEN